MSGFAISPFLVATMVAFFAVIVVRTHTLSRRERMASWGFLAILAGWIILSTSLSIRGVYRTEAFRALYPTLWYPFMPGILGIAALALPSFRAAALKIADATPLHWFVWFEAIRIAAIGTLIKTFQHTFPLVLELAVGVPDLIVGLSAPFVAVWLRRGQVARQALVLWHVIGIGVILINGAGLLHLGMPGPHYVLTAQPDTSVLFEFPLVLAPTFAVPMLVTVNIWMVVYLTRFRRRAEAAHGLLANPQYRKPKEISA